LLINPETGFVRNVAIAFDRFVIDRNVLFIENRFYAKGGTGASLTPLAVANVMRFGSLATL